MQSFELLMPFVFASYTMWATPGPNNMMLTYSGARFGFKRTLPHILGIISGTCALVFLSMMGLKPLIDQWPVALLILKVLGSVWLVLIGWKMAHAQKGSTPDAKEKPMGFIAALLFQFANPKALTATLAILSLLFVALEAQPDIIWWAFLVIPPLSFMAITPWVLAGQSIRRFLSTPLRWQVFSWTTGALTAGCVLFLWI